MRRLGIITLLLGMVAVWPAIVYGHDPHLRLPWPSNRQHYIWYDANTYNCDTHIGVDYYAIDFQFSLGEEVTAVQGGIAKLGDDPGGYGLFVDVDHGNTFVTRYAHLSSQSVADNQRVKQGDVLGGAGQTGKATGVHLHFRMTYQGKEYMPEPMSGVTGFGNWGYCQPRFPKEDSPSWYSTAPPSILLRNRGFEEGTAYWQNTPGSNFITYTNGAPEGYWYAEANTGNAGAGAAIWQDWPPSGNDWSQFNHPFTFLKHPDAWTFGTWARSNDGTTLSGRIEIRVMGSGAGDQVGQTSFTLSSTDWKLIEATVYPTHINPSHNRIRVKIYMNTTDRNYDFDDSANLRNYINNTSWESGTSYWNRRYGCENMLTRDLDQPTTDVRYYMETNPNACAPGASIYQDVTHYMGPGEVYYLRVWIRSRLGEAASGNVTLWALGSPQNVNVNTSWSILAGDTSWRDVGIPWSGLGIPSGDYRTLRAELYMDPGGYCCLDYDGARLWGGSGG